MLFKDLEGSMKKRREFAWKIVEQVLQPVKLKLLDGVTEVDVPLWQTWYEGPPFSRLSKSGDHEKALRALFQETEAGISGETRCRFTKPVIKDTIKEFETKDLSSRL